MSNKDAVILELTAPEYNMLIQMLESGQWTGNVQAMEVLSKVYRVVKGNAVPYNAFVERVIASQAQDDPGDAIKKLSVNHGKL